MSIKYMSLVWEFSRHKGTALLLLLAIADHANDDGVAWPSLKHLARKARMGDKWTKLVINALLQTEPVELVRLHEGGRGLGDSARYKIVLQPHAHGLKSVGGVDAHATITVKSKSKNGVGGGGPPPKQKRGEGEAGLRKRGRRASSQGEAGLQKRGRYTSPEPSRNHQQLTTTTTASENAAAAAGEVWTWDSLASALKLPKKRVADLTGGESSPAAFVGLYLYALGAPRLHSPGLWASKQLTDDAAARAGEPYDTLAALAPADLARVCAWLRDGGPVPGNGAEGAALAWRGHLLAKHKSAEALAVAAGQVINELGLPIPPVEAYEPSAPPPALEVDAWEHLLANGLSRNLPAAALERLRRCRLLSEGPDGMTVGVAHQHDWDWLSRAIAPDLERWHRVKLIRVPA